MQDIDDNERLERWRRGDTSGLDELVQHYRRPLFGFILRMTEGYDEADEIFQEVWFRALRGLEHYRDRRFLSWLFKITHNLIIDRHRRRKPDVSLDDETGDQIKYQVADHRPSPADVLQSDDSLRRIRHAVDRLPFEQREVFLMRMELDLPFKEIATIQKISINTALARMSYALSKLRHALADDYAELSRGKS